MKRKDLSNFFEKNQRQFILSFDQEIDMLRGGIKKFSVFECTEDKYEAVLRSMALVLDQKISICIRRNVNVVVESGLVWIFVVAPGEEWRIESFMLLQEIMIEEHKWSDALEYLQSRILSYSTEDADLWLSSVRQRRMGWNGKTIYFILNDTQYADLAENGYRTIDISLCPEGLDVFFSRNSRPTHKSEFRDESMLRIVVRASVKFSIFHSVFGLAMASQKFDIVIEKLKNSMIGELNRSLESDFEFVSFL